MRSYERALYSGHMATGTERLVSTVLGAVVGAVVGVIAGFLGALVLYWLGIDFTSDEVGPLDFEDAYVAWLIAVWLVPLTGLAVGAALGWRRAGRPDALRKAVAVIAIAVGAALALYSIPFVTYVAFAAFLIGGAAILGGIRLYAGRRPARDGGRT